jgi:hypothetical protein
MNQTCPSLIHRLRTWVHLHLPISSPYTITPRSFSTSLDQHPWRLPPIRLVRIESYEKNKNESSASRKHCLLYLRDKVKSTDMIDLFIRLVKNYITFSHFGPQSYVLVHDEFQSRPLKSKVDCLEEDGHNDRRSGSHQMNDLNPSIWICSCASRIVSLVVTTFPNQWPCPCINTNQDASFPAQNQHGCDPI